MHLSTMLPLIVGALHDEAVTIADGMRDLTLRQSLVVNGETPALCPNLVATSLVMRIVFVTESLIELRNALATGSPIVLPKSARKSAESSLDRYPLTGGVASDALRQLAARQEAVERRFEWLCQVLRLSPFPAQPLANPYPENKPMRALVIDDDEVYRLLISLTLTTLGYQVDEAHNGQFGWQLIQLSAYDLVVTDIVMPYQDGISVIRLLRDQYPSTRIIAVSGGGSLKSGFYLSAARPLGAHAVLAKPFSPSELSAAVAQACGETTGGNSGSGGGVPLFPVTELVNPL